MLKSLSVRVLIALVAGLALGAAVAAYGGAGLKGFVEGVESIGTLWLNGLRMTVVPLLFSVLVVGIASVADAAATGKLAVKALLWFLVLLLVGCAWTIAFGYGFYGLFPVSEAGAAALTAGAPPPPPEVQQTPSFGEFIKALAPTNPIRSAADDAILPLVFFAGFFAFAVTRLPDARRAALTEFFDTLSQAMVQIVRWVLWAAPVGVFALTLGVGLRAGVGAVGIIGHYIVAVVLAQLGITLFAYLLAVAVARIPLGQWARALAPVQVTAFATQSSIACLPAMIEQSRDALKVPDRVTGLVLPLAVSVFKMTSPVANIGVAIFVANVYGIEPQPMQWLAAVIIALAVSVASVGLPGQVSFFMSTGPICLALGLPLELLPILIAVEVIPDIFRTLGNVTGDMAVTAILAKDAEPDPAVDADVKPALG
ncbi:dicarboxylate/amino acid:cation symporter [Phenylobacterium sp. J367]|uniref:dicarboxylate/amino acid:cation symporter n=1 Tax=Phenylobacterium sp. J367 TaxID=2898435 RepID=UPI0021515336|nr:dicarboxylate/amino acid:cation symporter [Phenylobacterium sp. J367]MCR5878946.1 dicarboxylate/amino acid:cation symporter [Phenylobacterium sp. J367]